jgi:hypothetical protein
MRGPNWIGLGFLAAFALPWSFITLLGDYHVIRAAVRQHRALGYATVEGEVRECEVREHADDEGTTYRAAIEYTYRVGDQGYMARRIRYLAFWDHGSATRFAADHPPGSQVTVYYDPADPADAVLAPGPGGEELLGLLILVPFNAVMIGLVLGAGRTVLFGDPVASDWPTGVQFFESRAEARVRLPKTSPAAAGLAWLVGGAFFGAFVAAFVGGAPPPLPVAIAVWGVVLGGAGIAYRRASGRIAAGNDDLIIDRRRKTLTLPQACGRPGSVIVPLTQIQAVEVSVVRTKGDDSDQIRYAPTVRWRDTDGELRDGNLAEWDDRERAERLVEWIRSRAGTPAGLVTSPPPANK